MSVDCRRIATALLGREVRAARLTGLTAIGYDPFLAGREVARATGIAELDADNAVPWRAIVKRTAGSGLDAARRELAAYRTGVAAGTSAHSLCAPALIGWDEGPRHVELWLEELTDQHDGQWSVERFGQAAQAIARWDVETGRRRPDAEFAANYAWATQHGQPHRLTEAIDELRLLARRTSAGELMTLLDDPGFTRTEAMINSTVARIESLAGFPQSLLHHDLVRSNLFALADGRTAAIDWEAVGVGPLGADLAPLVVGSVRRGEASADDLDELERLVLDNYEQALIEAGAATDDVRPAYRLALGLRWHVVLGTIRAGLDPTVNRIRGARPEESRADGVRHLIVLSRHLLDAAESMCKVADCGTC